MLVLPILQFFAYILRFILLTCWPFCGDLLLDHDELLIILLIILEVFVFILLINLTSSHLHDVILGEVIVSNGVLSTHELTLPYFKYVLCFVLDLPL